MRQDLAVEQHSTWNGSVLNNPYRATPATFSSQQPANLQDNITPCLKLPLPSKWTYYFIFLLLMWACCNLRPCSPLTTVLNRLGDTYQDYCNTYKTHAMATNHGGSGQPLRRDANMTRKDTDVDIPQDFNHQDTDDFWKCRAWKSHQPSWMIYATESTLEKDNPQKLYIV